MIKLREYQFVALEVLKKALETSWRALVVMATGLGKTVVAATWAKGEIKKKQKGLFLCHDGGILDQSLVEFRKVLGNSYSLKTFYGDKKDWRADEADIVFASFQTLLKCNPFHEDEFDFIIVDESHHGQAPTFKEVIQYFKPKKLLGITATPDRMDLKDIREIFGNEIVNYSLEEAIARDWLTQIEYHVLNDNLNHWKLKKILQGVLEKGDRVSIKQLNETIFIQKRDEEIAKTIQEFTGSTKKAIIFCEKIEHAENFQRYLPGAFTYHSKVKGGKKELRKRLSAFREGSLQYILAIDKFNEGIDIPDAEVIVFLRCTDSLTIFYQQLGRGLRKMFGKEKVSVLDFVANCERLVMVMEITQRINEYAGNNLELSKEVLHVTGKSFDFCFDDAQIDILEVIKRINLRFVADFENLAMEYSVENVLPANEAITGTHSKYLWECCTCSHKWWARGYNRLVKKSGCPACAGQVPRCGDYLIAINPEMAEKYSIDNAIPFEKVVAQGCKFNPFEIFSWLCSGCGITHELSISGALRKKNLCSICIEKEDEKKIFLKKCRDEEIRKKYYNTLQECLDAALLVGARDWDSYREARKNDSRLPPSPNTFFDDCGVHFLSELNNLWRIRTGNEFYVSITEAVYATFNLGIRNQSAYAKNHKKDCRLPPNPNDYYSDNLINFWSFLVEVSKSDDAIQIDFI